MSDSIQVMGRGFDIVEILQVSKSKDPGDDMPLLKVQYKTRTGATAELRVTLGAAADLIQRSQGYLDQPSV